MNIENCMMILFISIESILALCALCFSALSLYKFYKSKTDDGLLSISIACFILIFILIILGVFVKILGISV